MKQKSFSKFMSTSFIVLLISAMLLLTSCSREGTSGTTPEFRPYIGGNSAVNMKFVDGMPPDAVGAILDNGKSTFSVGVQLINEGEHDINAETEGDFLKVTLEGIKANMYGLTENDLVMNLENDLLGQTKNVDGSITMGSREILSIDEMSYQADNTGDMPVNFLVDLCYDYITRTSTRICVADNVNRALNSEKDLQICNVNSNRDVINSAGPIQVVNFVQRPNGGSRVGVSFEVQRVGTGQLYLYEGDNECEFDLGDPDMNKVVIRVYLPDGSDSRLTCNGFDDIGGGVLESTVTVFPDAPYPLSCVVSGTEGGNSIFLETLNVDLLYRYNEQVTKSIVIRDSGSDD